MKNITYRFHFSLSKIYAFLMFGLAICILIFVKDAANAIASASIGAGLIGLKTYTVNRKEIKELEKPPVNEP